MPLYQNSRTKKIVSMSDSAYKSLTKIDALEFQLYTPVEVKIPDVLKEIVENKPLKEVKKRGRHAKV